MIVVIARERSDRGNLFVRNQIATVAALPRNDKRDGLLYCVTTYSHNRSLRVLEVQFKYSA